MFKNSILKKKKKKPRGFPILAYTGRLRRKGLPFSGFRYSYFEKGCPIKCTRQPQKCIVRGLEFTVFQRNLKQWQEIRGHEHMSASAKGK